MKNELSRQSKVMNVTRQNLEKRLDRLEQDEEKRKDVKSVGGIYHGYGCD